MGWKRERMHDRGVHYDVVKVIESQGDKGLDYVGGHREKTVDGYD